MFQQFPHRQDGQIILYLSKAHPSPPVPFELQGHISPDDWAMRVPALTKLAARYHKPIFERVWLSFAVFFTFILPLVLYRPLFIAIYKHDGTDASQYVVARLVGFAIFLGALLLFLSPVLVWKSIGKQRVNALLASYATADAMRPVDTGFIPKWKVSIPGVFSMHTILRITLPPNTPITSFRVESYLQSYIGKEVASPEGAYFYPYPAAASREAGLPRMSVVGGYAMDEKV